MLMEQLGAELASHFKDSGVTKVVTIESSGIAPALMTAKALGVPMIILKKEPSKVLNENLFQTVVTSYTKGTSYELTLSQDFISEADHVLIIDDFLANGEAATGADPPAPQGKCDHRRSRCPELKNPSSPAVRN